MTGSLARLAGTLSSPLSEPTPNRVAMSMIGLVQRNHDIDVGQRPPGHLPSALARARTSSSIITVTRIIASYYRGMATADATTGPAAGPAERVRASPRDHGVAEIDAGEASVGRALREAAAERLCDAVPLAALMRNLQREKSHPHPGRTPRRIHDARAH